MKLRFSILCIIHANSSFNRRPLPSIRREDDRSKYCARIRNVQRARRQLQMANDSPYIAYAAGLRSILWFLSQNNAKPQSRLFFRFLSPSPLPPSFRIHRKLIYRENCSFFFGFSFSRRAASFLCQYDAADAADR